MNSQVLVKVLFDKTWIAFIYLLITAIMCIEAIFRASFLVGFAAFMACILCYIGTAGFVGSFLARHDKHSSATVLIGIAAIAAILDAAGIALMIWSGFWIGLFGVAIDGPYWTLVGILTALLATKKTDVL